MPRVEGLTPKAYRLLTVLRKHDDWMKSQELAAFQENSQITRYQMQLLKKMVDADLIEMRQLSTSRRGRTPYEYKSRAVLPSEMLTPHGHRLLQVLRTSSVWLTREELAQNIGRAHLNDNDLGLLQRMVNLALITVRPAHVRKLDISGYEFRVKAIKDDQSYI